MPSFVTFVTAYIIRNLQDNNSAEIRSHTLSGICMLSLTLLNPVEAHTGTRSPYNFVHNLIKYCQILIFLWLTHCLANEQTRKSTLLLKSRIIA